MGPKDPIQEPFMTSLFAGLHTRLQIASDLSEGLSKALLKQLKILAIHLGILSDNEIKETEVE